MSPGGGPPQVLYRNLNPGGATWSTNGSILFQPLSFQGLYQLSQDGSAAQIRSVARSAFEAGYRWPSFLPDGKHYLYFVLSSGKESSRVYVGKLGSNERKLLLTDADSFAAFSPPGYLLFIRGTSLMAQAFNPNSQELSGEAFPVAQNVGRYDDAGPTGYSPFSVSTNGVLACGSVKNSQSQLVWMDRGGREIGTASPVGTYSEPSLSPDESQVAIEMLTDGATDLWLMEHSRNIPTRFTSGAVGRASVWSPDGKEIVYISEESGAIDLYRKDTGGVGKGRPLLHSSQSKIPDDWSQDGRFLIYEVSDPKTGNDLWILPMTGAQDPFPFLATEYAEQSARFSPDGRWITYTSNESGRIEVYVQGFGNNNERWRISSNGGRMPRWRSDGKELFYVAGDHQLISVPIESGATLKIGSPVLLFRVPMAEFNITSENRTEYAVARDGQRFLVNKQLSTLDESPITVITNWTARLKR